MPDYLQYQAFLSPEAAEPLLALLDQQKIPFETSFDQHDFDITFAYNPTRTQFVVKLHPQDFDKARAVETETSKQQIASVSSDYHLFDFTEEELFTILVKPDEWNNFDVTLAQQILRDRGRDVSADTVALLSQHRMAELGRPEEVQKSWIMAGYLFALCGGVVGLIIGWHLAFHKKQLPNGHQKLAFSEEDRTQGRRILALSSLVVGGSLLISLLLP